MGDQDRNRRKKQKTGPTGPTPPDPPDETPEQFVTRQYRESGLIEYTNHYQYTQNYSYTHKKEYYDQRLQTATEAADRSQRYEHYLRPLFRRPDYRFEHLPPEALRYLFHEVWTLAYRTQWAAAVRLHRREDNIERYKELVHDTTNAGNHYVEGMAKKVWGVAAKRYAFVGYVKLRVKLLATIRRECQIDRESQLESAHMRSDRVHNDNAPNGRVPVLYVRGDVTYDRIDDLSVRDQYEHRANLYLTHLRQRQASEGNSRADYYMYENWFQTVVEMVRIVLPDYTAPADLQTAPPIPPEIIDVDDETDQQAVPSTQASQVTTPYESMPTLSQFQFGGRSGLSSQTRHSDSGAGGGPSHLYGQSDQSLDNARPLHLPEGSVGLFAHLLEEFERNQSALQGSGSDTGGGPSQLYGQTNQANTTGQRNQWPRLQPTQRQYMKNLNNGFETPLVSLFAADPHLVNEPAYQQQVIAELEELLAVVDSRGLTPEFAQLPIDWGAERNRIQNCLNGWQQYSQWIRIDPIRSTRKKETQGLWRPPTSAGPTGAYGHSNQAQVTQQPQEWKRVQPTREKYITYYLRLDLMVPLVSWQLVRDQQLVAEPAYRQQVIRELRELLAVVDNREGIPELTQLNRSTAYWVRERNHIQNVINGWEQYTD